MAISLRDKVVIITGASMGIGAATAHAFAREGANLTLAARSLDRLNDLAHSLPDHENKVLVTQCDITDHQQVQAMVKATIGKFGRVDILINNAAYALQSYLATAPMDEMRAQFETNVFAHLACIQAVYPHMKAQGSGQIVNISSVIGLRSIPTVAPYCMTKFALNALSEGLRIEARADGIDVLSVCPSVTDTPFRENQKTLSGAPQRPVSMKGQSPDEVAAAIVNACRKRKRDTVLTLPGKVLKQLNHFMPSLIDWALYRAMKKKVG